MERLHQISKEKLLVDLILESLTFDDTLDVESVNIQFATFYNTSNSVGDNHTLFNASITTSSELDILQI